MNREPNIIITFIPRQKSEACTPHHNLSLLLQLSTMSVGVCTGTEKEEKETAQRGSPLEDWPMRESMTFAPSFGEAEDDATSASVSVDSRPQRHLLRDVHVNFSETSQLYVYKRESSSSLRYTKKDYDKFKREALLEALRIKDIIATAQQDSMAESIKYLLQHDIVSREELLGIEHFVLGKPSAVHQNEEAPRSSCAVEAAQAATTRG